MCVGPEDGLLRNNFETIVLDRWDGGHTITLNRPEHQNALNERMIVEIREALVYLEQRQGGNLVLLKGKPGIFCTGQDFGEVGVDRDIHLPMAEEHPVSPYLELLKTMAQSSKIIVAVVDGKALAGGIGLVAASDLVVSTPASQFGLPEALWGLLPAIVTPFLIRKVGFQAAYRMALTTIPLSAADARSIGLVDEIGDDPAPIIHRLLLRVSKLRAETIQKTKKYFSDMWIIDQKTETLAVRENILGFSDPYVIETILNFRNFNKLPWDSN